MGSTTRIRMPTTKRGMRNKSPVIGKGEAKCARAANPTSVCFHRATAPGHVYLYPRRGFVRTRVDLMQKNGGDSFLRWISEKSAEFCIIGIDTLQSVCYNRGITKIYRVFIPERFVKFYADQTGTRHPYRLFAADQPDRAVRLPVLAPGTLHAESLPRPL